MAEQIIKVIQRFHNLDKDVDFDLGGQDARTFSQEELIDVISNKGYKCESLLELLGTSMDSINLETLVRLALAVQCTGNMFSPEGSVEVVNMTQGPGRSSTSSRHAARVDDGEKEPPKKKIKTHTVTSGGADDVVKISEVS